MSSSDAIAAKEFPFLFFMFRSLTLEVDRLKRLEDDLRKREVTLSNMELHVDQQVQMKLNK